MSDNLFGTDGIRGIPGKEPLSEKSIETIAFIAARVLKEAAKTSLNGTKPCIALGRDTRGSGPALVKALARGFASAGVRTLDLGIIPTPGVSYLAPRLGCFAGVVVSASHNPAEYNGIKFFDRLGFKMDLTFEKKIENEFKRFRRPQNKSSQPDLVDATDQHQRYRDFLRSSFPATLDLTGTRIIVDCANGAASNFAPQILSDLGAKVIAIGINPNGRNINKNCGVLHSQRLQKILRQKRADVGVAFDGDADRALLCDEKGVMLDGDAVIGAAAMRLLSRGGLRGSKVALTVMSNYGLIRYLSLHGVDVITTSVGDRHVTAAIEREGLSLGGENSGHVVFRDFAPTGDGILTALQTLAAWRESQKPMSALRRLYVPTPQTLIALHIQHKPALQGLKRTQATIKKVTESLAGRGRVLVRYSGTEPVLRVLVEGPRKIENEQCAKQIAQIYLMETKGA